MNEALGWCVKLLRVFEGCVLRAYLCPAKVWTICFGSTTGVQAGMTKTQTECDLLLIHEARAFMLRVLQLCPTLAKHPQRLAAVTSLAYNIGLGAFAASTLRRKCLREEWASADAEFPKWNKGGGRVLRGLVLRREAERRVFVS